MKQFLCTLLCLLFLTSCGAQSTTLAQNKDGSMTLLQNATEVNSIYVSADGKMGIGKQNPTDKLEVNGQIHARSVKVDLDKWADFVFEKDYELIRLRDIESYIKKHGHLPEIPTTETVRTHGIELGQMNRLLLQKVEELTLHLIEKEKQIDQLAENLSTLQKEVHQLKKKY